VFEVTFKKLDVDSIELLRNWRNTERISQNMLSTDHISEEQQQAWFKKIDADPAERYFVCYSSDTPVGMLCFNGITETDCEWGCYVGTDKLMPGFGLVFEAAALDYAFTVLGLKTLKANVLSHNTPALKMHKLFKYQDLGQVPTDIVRNGEELMMSQFVYQNTDWQTNQEQVFKLIPKKILESIKNVKFV
jgi:UDP-4-amino-4,6-dideoxy-N-acetyl-beta-L-altrosamine N-acetyltransferase